MYRNKKEVVLLPVRNTPFIHPPRVWRHGLGGWLNPVQDGWRTSIIRVTSPPAQPFTHLPSVSFEQPTVWDVVLIITSSVNSSSIWISKTEACSNIWKESMSVERRSVTKNHKYHSQVRVKEKWVMLKKNRLYSDSYLAIGFTWTGEEGCPLPLCIVCGKKLANTAMAPAKLKRHFTTNHSHLSNKTVDYFRRLLDSQQKQRNFF